MTNADRAAVAQRIIEVAKRLAGTPARAEEAAKTKYPQSPHAFEAGMLGQAVIEASGELERIVAHYLTPKPPQPRRSRARR